MRHFPLDFFTSTTFESQVVYLASVTNFASRRSSTAFLAASAFSVDCFSSVGRPLCTLGRWKVGGMRRRGPARASLLRSKQIDLHFLSDMLSAASLQGRAGEPQSSHSDQDLRPEGSARTLRLGLVGPEKWRLDESFPPRLKIGSPGRWSRPGGETWVPPSYPVVQPA